MAKLAAAPFLIAAACLMASALGVFQDLLTYRISPAWYEDWKFYQFGIPAQHHNAFGAALVGIGATWWMGLVLSVPVLGAAAFAPGRKSMAAIFLKGALLVLMLTIAAELFAYIWGLVQFDAASAPAWAQRFDDPVAAQRVQFINAVGYMAAAAASLIALIYVIWKVRSAG